MQKFDAFTADDPEEKSMKVLIETIEIEQAGALILIRVRGSHFLWKMVRRMVGVLAAVGRGDIAPEDAARFLESDDRSASKKRPPRLLRRRPVFFWRQFVTKGIRLLVSSSPSWQSTRYALITPNSKLQTPKECFERVPLVFGVWNLELTPTSSSLPALPTS